MGKLNIIANDCVGARIYQHKKLEYENPFIWCLIPPDSFSYLYNHYKNIDFNDIELKKDGEWYNIVINKKVTVYYPHYRFDKDAKKPEKRAGREIDVYYCRIDEYILEKYWSRVKRMTGKPIFIINDTKTTLVDGKCNFQKSDIEKYVNKPDCFIITNDKTIKGKNVAYKEKEKTSSGDAAKIILKKTGI